MNTISRCALIEQGSGRRLAPGQVNSSQVILNKPSIHNRRYYFHFLCNKSRFNGRCARLAAGDDCGSSTATFANVRNQVLAERDLRLTLSTIGPLYRITCTVEEQPEDGGDVCTILLGETDGFVVPPLKLMHCDTMRIYNSRLKSCKTDRRLGFMGLGRVMAQAVFAHGLEKGCEKAEILAINDDDEMHQKLVRYYERMGFEVECEVTGGNVADIFHLLVWGGVGTRMNADLRQVFRKVDQH